MTLRGRTLAAIAGVALWLLALGFVVFATVVTRSPTREDKRADGIVVLTGGQIRIAEGARLLVERRGQRLLISGVNPHTQRESLRRLSGLDERQFTCCVDLGYSALDTVGNAAETRTWAEALNYDSLIIVTASYHMPRSLAELGRVMPSTELIPHSVVPKNLRQAVWWLDATATRLLVSEYIKFVPAAARLVVARAMGPWRSNPVADASTVFRTKS